MKKFRIFFKRNRLEFVVFILSFVFSLWLMFSTFSYRDGNMLIASKAWSDFASHIPLIRSFSLGDNFLPQYPLFSGPPIKYHFVFYALVGFLEYLGIRIDYALNIPSVIGFSFLILMIFTFSKLLFKRNSVAVLSVILFLVNGSLSFIKFFQEHISSKNIFLDIISNKQFTSFAPYDQTSIVSAFWNLNIFTNQRHLALSYGLSMLILYFILKAFFVDKRTDPRVVFLLGIIFGISFFVNIAVFLMTGIILLTLFIFLKKFRKEIFTVGIIGAILGFPQYLYSQKGETISYIFFYPGYLINSALTIFNFINYWFYNLGLHLIFIPLGFILANKKAKIVFISFFSLFIVGNLFKFSPEIAANHKFFNYFMIIGVMFTSYALVYLWNKKNILKPVVVVVFLLLTLSGILDFFPIFNDTKIVLADYPNNKDISWIIKNTKPDSIFLNTQYLYDNASLAGRKIFLGWPYFAWSQGYDTTSRDNLRKTLLSTSDLKIFCEGSLKNGIDYAELNLNSQDAVVNKPFFDKNFPVAYHDDITRYYVYRIKVGCI